MSRGVCRAAAIALTGLEGTAVMVEAAVSQQLPGMAIIGLPDAALAEAKQRVRTASNQAGLPLTDRFVVVNLAPASLPKQGSGFDLAIALAALAASRHLPATRLATTAHIGELGLDGGLRRPVGLLGAVIAARDLGFARVMVPAEGGDEARLVPDIDVVEAGTLAAAVAWHRGEEGEWVDSAETLQQSVSVLVSAQSGATEIRGGPATEARTPAQPAAGIPDMAEVVGQPEAVEAMAVAAAGRHHISLTGPPGSGKTLLATRLATILPDLSPSESLVASSIASLSGAPLRTLTTRSPFENPHHTASSAAIVGGGDARGIRPGAISRASYGILFLDEAPEFGRVVLDGLREPLESGVVTISRARIHASLPARFQLVLAANPCPCGNAGAPGTALLCTCSPHVRVRYLARLSGPLTDRVDLRISVHRVTSLLPESASAGARPSSAQLRERVALARKRAHLRLARTPWTCNGEVPGEWLRDEAQRLPTHETAIIDRALARGALTLRGYDRILRIAWTIADLAGESMPGRSELAQALALRGGHP